MPQEKSEHPQRPPESPVQQPHEGIVGSEMAATIPPKPVSQDANRSDRSTTEAVPEFPDYTVLSEIARGGMGVVYRAQQHSLERIVALKTVLAGRFASAAEIDLFHTEARAAGQLNHPGIVPVYDIGESNGIHYFSMPLIDGVSLAELVIHKPLAPDDAAQLIKSAAETMQFAHDNQLVHRDLKPANILVDQHHKTHIMDFGIASRSGSVSSTTRTESIHIGGTPEFMSPEQASGEATAPTSDIYSLGATLYCLLTGRPPFQSHNPVDTVVAVLESRPVPPRQLNEGIPRDLELICLKCLRKKPQQRYATAQELADELHRFLLGEPVHVHPVGNIGTFLRWMRRQPRQAATATGLVLSFTAAMATSVYYNYQLDVQRQVAEEALSAADDETARARNLQRITQTLLSELVTSESGMISALQYSALGAVISAGARMADADSWADQSVALTSFQIARKKLSAEHAITLAPALDQLERTLAAPVIDAELLKEDVEHLRQLARSAWVDGIPKSSPALEQIRQAQYSEFARRYEVLNRSAAGSATEADVSSFLNLVRGELAVVVDDVVYEELMNMAELLQDSQGYRFTPQSEAIAERIIADIVE